MQRSVSPSLPCTALAALFAAILSILPLGYASAGPTDAIAPDSTPSKVVTQQPVDAMSVCSGRGSAEPGDWLPPEINLQLNAPNNRIGEQDWSGRDLSGNDFKDKVFTHVTLKNANLRSADLSGAIICGSDLTGADLTGAHLDHALIAGGTSLDGANLTGASWTSRTHPTLAFGPIEPISGMPT